MPRNASGGFQGKPKSARSSENRMSAAVVAVCGGNPFCSVAHKCPESGGNFFAQPGCVRMTSRSKPVQQRLHVPHQQRLTAHSQRWFGWCRSADACARRDQRPERRRGGVDGRGQVVVMLVVSAHARGMPLALAGLKDGDPGVP